MSLRREHVVGLRTDLPSCKVRVVRPTGSTPGGGGIIIYPCDNLLVLSDPSSGSQSFVETTKPNHKLVAYDVCSDGSLLALAETKPSSGGISSLVTLYSLTTTTTTTTTNNNNNNNKPMPHAKKKKKVIRIDSGILHIGFVDATHILILGDGPDYSLTLWSTGSCAGSGHRTPTKGSATKHPGACLASTKLATPSGKTIYRANVSPFKDEAGNALVCVTGDGVLRLFRLSTANSTFRPVTVNLKRKQQNYISQLWLSSGQIALGTDAGEILIIEKYSTQTVLKLPEPHATATCLEEISDGDLIAGSDGATLHLYELAHDMEARFEYKTTTCMAIEATTADVTITSLSASVGGDQAVVYAAASDNRLMTVPLLDLFTKKSCDAIKIQQAIPTFLSSRESIGTNSIDICSWRPLLAVSSSNAQTQNTCVQIWNYHTRNLEASKNFEGDGPIRSICFHPSSFQLVIGTKEKLIMCDLAHRAAIVDDECPSTIKTSGQIDMASAITLCRYSNGGQYLAVCCGSTVFVYDAFTFTAICTLKGHSADLVEIGFQDGDQALCTVGGDGVLCAWSIPSGKKLLRHVNALSSYTCGVIDGRFTRAIVCDESSVSTIELNLREKKSTEDISLNESWSKLQISSCGQIVIGTPTRSIEGETEAISIATLPVEKVAAQLDAASSMQQISSIRLFKQNLFVASSSGSMHHFTVLNDSPGDDPLVEGTATNTNTILSDQVLVSESDLAERRALIQSLETQLTEVQQHNVNEIQRLDDKYGDTLKDIREQNELDAEENQRQCQEATKRRRKMEHDFDESTANAEKAHSAKMKSIEQTIEQKIVTEIQRTKSMKSECAAKTSQWNRDIKSMEDQTANEIERISSDFNRRTDDEVQLQEMLSEQQKDLLDKHHRLMESLEATGDDEITRTTLERERELLVEQKATRHLREEQAILKAKLDSLTSDLDEQKDTIESLQEKEVELMAGIDEAKDYNRRRQNDIQAKADESQAKKDDELDLRRRCNELNQKKARLKEEIVHRKELLSQMEADIVDKEKNAARIRTNLATSKRANSNVNLAIANLKDKAFGLDRERQRQKSQIEERAAYTLELEKDIRDLVSASGHGEVKAKLLPVCARYLKTAGDSSSVTTSTEISSKRGSEIKRREQHLCKKIHTIKKAIAKAEKKHTQDMARLRWQQKVLKQNLAEMASSDNSLSDATPEEKENTTNAMSVKQT